MLSLQAYRDRLPPDDIHSNGDTRLSSVHTDAHELLKSEVKTPGNALELVDALSTPFRNKVCLCIDKLLQLSSCSRVVCVFSVCAS